MVTPPFIVWSPLLGAAAWFAVVAYLLLQQRYRTWTEVFFLALCVSTGAYALFDTVFFNLPGPATAGSMGLADLTIAASASLASLTFAILFLYLYGVSLYRRFQGFLLLALIPVAFFAATFSEEMFTGFQSIGGANGPYDPVYRETWLYAWIALMVVLALIGLYGVFRAYLEIRKQSPRLARRIGITLLGFVIALVAGSATNTLLALTGQAQPPLFSTALAVPGVLVLFATTPNVSQRINETLRRRKASQLDIKGAFLTFNDGTLIGSKLVPEEDMIDADSFSATLDVIQNFMRTSFPTLRGKWLQSIRHGDYTLVMERGKYAALTLVLGGLENDQLRRHMQDVLIEYERRNMDVLARWRGVAADATGTEPMLEELLSGS